MTWYEPERVTTIRYEPKPFQSPCRETYGTQTTIRIPLPSEAKWSDSCEVDWTTERAILCAITPKRNGDDAAKRELSGDVDQRGAIVFQTMCRLHPCLKQMYLPSKKPHQFHTDAIYQLCDFFLSTLLPLGWAYEVYPFTSSYACLPWPAYFLLRIAMTHIRQCLPSLRGIYRLTNALLVRCDLPEKWGPALLAALVIGRPPREGDEQRLFWDEWKDWRRANSYGSVDPAREDASVKMLFRKGSR